MNSLIKFNKVYFVLAVLIFFVEVLIAKYAHDQIIRPYFGDVLVVILIYCSSKSILNTTILPTAIAVLLFSFFIESMQYIHIVDRLGLQDSPILSTVIGTSFSWVDIIAYIIGFSLVLFFEKIIFKRSLK